LHIPWDLALDSRGRLYIADAGSCRIRRIDELGIISTIAGNGTCGSSGDDGPALSAEISPTSLAADDFGNVYFVESSTCDGETDPVSGECIGGTVTEGSYRVRKVSSNGQISTAVGTGEKYNPAIHSGIGDGGPASEAVLVNPTSVSLDAEGNIYLGDGASIRKVNTSGLISTVVGTGYSGYSGDGGLARNAQVALVSGITFDRSGNFYFAQFYHNGDVVRRVTSNGYISTVAGNGAPGLAGDQGPATRALLAQPERVAVDPAGDIYIPDRDNRLVRKVSIPTYRGTETRFAEESGIGHLISSAGLHQSTYDLRTGVALLRFGYDIQNRLVTITDQFNRVTTIERQSNGTAGAIVSPDGLRTELGIDSHNQLTSIRYPGNKTHTFEYGANDGLLTAKVEPNGNRFEHVFDAGGRISQTTNQEGGLWRFSKTEAASGETTSQIITPNTGATVKTLNQSSGSLRKTSIAPSGKQTISTTSDDGLDITVTSTCGPTVQTFSDLDREFGYIAPTRTTITSPAGLIRESSLVKAYTDADTNGIPELVTEQRTLNGRSSVLVQDIGQSRLSMTSPAGRSVTTSYDPATLRPLSVQTAGLLPTTYQFMPL